MVGAACSPAPPIPESGRIDVVGFMNQVDEQQRTWTIEHVKSAFGTPVQEHASGAKYVLRYYGIEFTLSESDIETIVFTDARYSSPEGLRIGHAQGHVRQMIGVPLAVQENTWEYRTAKGTRIVIHWENDHISRLEWHY